MTVDDFEIADEITASAFGPSSTRASEIRRYFAVTPNHWVLAAMRDVAAGVLAATDYGPFAYLGMMTVRRELQRRGIGRALLHHVLQWTDQEGIPLLRLDATEAGFPLYAESGFEVCDHALLYRLSSSLRPQQVPEHTRSLGAGDLQDLAEFDTPIFGGERTGLFRELLRDFPNRAFATYDGSGGMTGFLFAQPGRLGPWAARSPEDAEALLKAASTLAFDGLPLAIAPGMNVAAANLLERAGFRLETRSRHMQRGTSSIPGERTAIYGLASFAMG
jgi:GNAT superfamily N-acetyltransferase